MQNVLGAIKVGASMVTGSWLLIRGGHYNRFNCTQLQCAGDISFFLNLKNKM